MAATRGPVPKRSAERRRRNSESKADVVKLPAAAPPVTMPPPDEEWHPTALRWYLALGESGQALFYEPSDWAAAHYVAQAMSINLNQGKFSSVLFGCVWSAMTDLLTTEGSRRRVRMEIERGGEPEKPASVATMANYRKTLRG